MRSIRLPSWAFGLLGAVTALGAGSILGAGESSPASVWRLPASVAVLALLPLTCLWFRGGKRRTALLALWIGATTTVLVFVMAIGSAVGQAAALLYLILLSVALLAGSLAQALFEEGTAIARRRVSGALSDHSSNGAA